jgi:hypothetical protein
MADGIRRASRRAVKRVALGAAEEERGTARMQITWPLLVCPFITLHSSVS